MANADVSRNRFERMIRAIALAVCRLLGFDRTPEPSRPDTSSNDARAQHAAETAERHLRFRRAVLMLDLAVAHARHGFPDSARTILNAAWADLRNNRAAQIQHRATAALIFALGGSNRQATIYLEQALKSHTEAHATLSPTVRRRIYQLCTDTMEQLPHSRHIEQTIRDVYIARNQGDYVTALRLLEQADQACTLHARLLSPRTTNNRLTAWYEILEDMHRQGGDSTRTILNAFRFRSAPASTFAGAAA